MAEFGGGVHDHAGTESIPASDAVMILGKHCRCGKVLWWEIPVLKDIAIAALGPAAFIAGGAAGPILVASGAALPGREKKVAYARLSDRRN